MAILRCPHGTSPPSACRKCGAAENSVLIANIRKAHRRWLRVSNPTLAFSKEVLEAIGKLLYPNAGAQA